MVICDREFDFLLDERPDQHACWSCGRWSVEETVYISPWPLPIPLCKAASLSGCVKSLKEFGETIQSMLEPMQNENLLTKEQKKEKRALEDLWSGPLGLSGEVTRRDNPPYWSFNPKQLGTSNDNFLFTEFNNATLMQLATRMDEYQKEMMGKKKAATTSAASSGKKRRAPYKKLQSAKGSVPAPMVVTVVAKDNMDVNEKGGDIRNQKLTAAAAAADSVGPTPTVTVNINKKKRKKMNEQKQGDDNPTITPVKDARVQTDPPHNVNNGNMEASKEVMITSPHDPKKMEEDVDIFIVPHN